jgi:hypothetical protein
VLRRLSALSNDSVYEGQNGKHHQFRQHVGNHFSIMPLLTPSPKFHVDDEFGNPAVGWKLYSYLAGTSTPKATYPAYTLGAANPNPTILDARGEATIFLDGNYKLVLKDDSDAVIWTVDDVRDITSSATFSGATLAGTLTITSTAVTWSGNPTHSGNHTFTNNVTIKGNTSLGDANTDTLAVAPNAITWTNNPTHSGNHTFSGNISVSGTLGVTGVATFSANPAGKVIGDKYTPTLTGMANVAASSANEHRYIRVGAFVTVNGSISVTPTAAAATFTQLAISLPFTTNLSSLYDIRAPAAPDNSLGHTTPFLSADTGNERAILNFFSGSTGVCGWSYCFTYEVKA